METARQTRRMMPPNKPVKPTLLSRVSVRVFPFLRCIASSLVTLRKPQGGLCAVR